MGGRKKELIMLEKDTIQLNEVKTAIEEKKLVVRVKVKNPLDRTLYAYGSVRRILYDDSSGKLTLCLHDQHQEDDKDLNSLHLPVPRIVQLEGKTAAEIKIKLAPTINRMRSAAERAGGKPLVETMNISEAKEIIIELAHEDTPFYFNPKISNSKQFKGWGKAVSRASFKVAPFNKR
jgi:hypothetical protein